MAHHNEFMLRQIPPSLSSSRATTNLLLQLTEMNKNHQDQVAQVSVAVKRHFVKRTPFKIYHGSTNSTRTLTFKKSEMVDVSDFDQILSIDNVTRTVIVETNVPMDKLVSETLKYGLVSPVVPEFPGITVGGAIQGAAGESSSFKWGFFSQTINWVEMVLADGSVIVCSPSQNSDLFYGAAGASGTLGIITAAEILLVPAKRYVNLSYVAVKSFDEANSQLLSLGRAERDFIDCIMFGPDHGLIIIGNMSDEATGKLRKFTRAIDEWYYLHVAKVDAGQRPLNDSLPLIDYLFRYDRGAFWVGRFAFERFGVVFNRLTRFVLDPLLHTRELYKALQDSGASQEHIVQDLTVPLNKAGDFMKYIDQRTGIYPLWICPIKPEPRSPLMCNSIETELAINVGIWGPRISIYEDFITLNRDLEIKLTEMSGKKWLYAHSYYTKDEFWKIYDKTWYDKLRLKYHATTLPDIYDKTYVKDRVSVNAKRGLLNTIFGKARLKIREQ